MTDKVPFLNERHLPFSPSTLETIDTSVFIFVNEKLDLFCETNEGSKKVPVEWIGKERGSVRGNDPENRDLSRTLIYPIIRIGRESEAKTDLSRGKYFGQIPPENDVKGGTITIAKKINQEKTSNFVNADSFRGNGVNGEVGIQQINFPGKNKKKKVVYTTITIPKPEYIQINYKIHLITEFQQQMNDLMMKIINNSGYKNYVGLEHEGHKYEAFIEEEYEKNDNVNEMGEEIRRFETIVHLRVYGYTIGKGPNDEHPFIVERENIVQAKIPRERVILGDVNQAISKGWFRQ